MLISDQQCQLERGPNALCVENFHAAITFATQTTSRRFHEGYRKILLSMRIASNVQNV